MRPKSRFSKRIFGHSAGSPKLDRPYCKRFWHNPVLLFVLTTLVFHLFMMTIILRHVLNIDLLICVCFIFLCYIFCVFFLLCIYILFHLSSTAYSYDYYLSLLLPYHHRRRHHHHQQHPPPPPKKKNRPVLEPFPTPHFGEHIVRFDPQQAEFGKSFSRDLKNNFLTLTHNISENHKNLGRLLVVSLPCYLLVVFFWSLSISLCLSLFLSLSIFTLSINFHTLSLYISWSLSLSLSAFVLFSLSLSISISLSVLVCFLFLLFSSLSLSFVSHVLLHSMDVSLSVLLWISLSIFFILLFFVTSLYFSPLACLCLLFVSLLSFGLSGGPTCHGTDLSHDMLGPRERSWKSLPEPIIFRTFPRATCHGTGLSPDMWPAKMFQDGPHVMGQTCPMTCGPLFKKVSVATPAEPRGEKKTFSCAIFGQWKTFKISWKVLVKYFLSGLRGAKHFSNTFRIVLRIFFAFFKPFFVSI